jgi:hypothetical protein
MERMELMSVLDVARHMGVSKDTIMAGLKQNKFSFGVAVKGTNSWRYIIPKKKYEAWCKENEVRQC